MKPVLVLSLILFFFTGCGSRAIIGTPSTFQKDSLLDTSTSVKPDWINKLPPETENCVFFVGEGTDTIKSLAEDNAKLNMLVDYAFYLGANIEVLEKIHHEEIKREQDEITKTKRQVITDVQALVNIYSKGCRFTETYWEKKWQINKNFVYYDCWLLGEINKKFIEAEREIISDLSNNDKVKDNFANSNLNVTVYAEKRVCRAGDQFNIEFTANDSCYAYILDFYGKGKIQFLDSIRMAKDFKHVLYATAEYREKSEEVLKFIVSDKPLDIDGALKTVYPIFTIKNLRSQAEAKGARYCDKYVTILIEPR